MEIDAEKLLLQISDAAANKRSAKNHQKAASVEPALSQIYQRLTTIEARELSSMPCLDEIYSYLVVIGKIRRPEHQSILEKFLDSTDPLTVSLVLETLCLEWRATTEYLERVIDFALGVPWDEEQDVKQCAINILGEYLHQISSATACTPSPTHMPEVVRQIVELLLANFEDTGEEPWIRQSCYTALARSAGVPSEQLPEENAMLDLNPNSEEIDWDLILNIKQVVRSEIATGSENR